MQVYFTYFSRKNANYFQNYLSHYAKSSVNNMRAHTTRYIVLYIYIYLHVVITYFYMFFYCHSLVLFPFTLHLHLALPVAFSYLCLYLYFIIVALLLFHFQDASCQCRFNITGAFRPQVAAPSAAFAHPASDYCAWHSGRLA